MNGDQAERLPQAGECRNEGECYTGACRLGSAQRKERF